MIKRNKGQEMLRSLQSSHTCTWIRLHLRAEQQQIYGYARANQASGLWAHVPLEKVLGRIASLMEDHSLERMWKICAAVWAWLLLTPPHRRPRTTVHLVCAAFLSLYNGCHFELLQLEFMCDSCVDSVQTFHNHWPHPAVLGPVVSAAAYRRTHRTKLVVEFLLTLSTAYCSSILLGLIQTNPNQKAFKGDFM